MRLPILHMGAKHTLDRIRERAHKDAHREFDPRFVQEFFVFSSDPALHDFLTRPKMDELLRHAARSVVLGHAAYDNAAQADNREFDSILPGAPRQRHTGTLHQWCAAG